MVRRKLGNTDVQVSAIALGCWVFGVDGPGHYADQQAVHLCQFALDQGITFFDTGDACGKERAEILVGQFLKTVPRHKVQIGSTFAYEFADAGRLDSSPKFMRSALEQSLRRLGTDYIDLYLGGNLKLPQFRDDLFAELEEVTREGKIRTWGISPGPAIGWREDGITAMMDHNAKAVQTVFSIFEQDPGREFCQVACAMHAGVLARDKSESWTLQDQKFQILQKYAASHSITARQFACKWLLQQPGLTAIVGSFADEQQIVEAAQVAEKPDLNMQALWQIAEDYARDWGLGPAAHPCDLRSSTSPTGHVRSSYIPPPVLIATSPLPLRGEGQGEG
jgi:aryl-alcohol dehydrogenase-like predicted oxidoreductase